MSAREEGMLGGVERGSSMEKTAQQEPEPEQELAAAAESAPGGSGSISLQQSRRLVGAAGAAGLLLLAVFLLRGSSPGAKSATGPNRLGALSGARARLCGCALGAGGERAGELEQERRIDHAKEISPGLVRNILTRVLLMKLMGGTKQD